MSTAPTSLAGRVALVTGSSKGLGRAMAMCLGRQGARVVLNYKNGREQAEAAFGEFCSSGYEGILVCASAVDEGEVSEMVRRAERELGPVDIVVSNATPAQPQRPFEEYDWAFHQEMLDYFVKSPFLLTRATLGGMKERRWGRIINIGSEVFDRGIPNFAPYVAAKGAQRGWTRSMAHELAGWNITVNMVSPGWIPVERHKEDPQEMKDEYLAGIPLGRWGVPADVGEAVAWIASEAAGFVTGQTLVVNGGVTVS